MLELVNATAGQVVDALPSTFCRGASLSTAGRHWALAARRSPARPHPSASGKPSTRISEIVLAIWRGGKLTTAATWRPTSCSGR